MATTQREGILFGKKTFGGYDKKEVVAYIERLSTDFQKEKQSLLFRLEQAQKEEASLKKELADLQEELALQLRQKAKAEEEKQQFLHDVTILSDEVVYLKKELSVYRSQAVSHKNRADEFEQKSKKYDDILSEVGKIMMDANDFASNIINNARNSAKDIASEVDKLSHEYKQKVEKTRSDITAVKQALRELILSADERLDEVLTVLDCGLTEKGSPFIEKTVPELTVVEEKASEDVFPPPLTDLPDSFFRPAAGDESV